MPLDLGREALPLELPAEQVNGRAPLTGFPCGLTDGIEVLEAEPLEHSRYGGLGAFRLGGDLRGGEARQLARVIEHEVGDLAFARRKPVVGLANQRLQRGAAALAPPTGPSRLRAVAHGHQVPPPALPGSAPF